MKHDIIKQLLTHKDATIYEQEKNYEEDPIQHLKQYLLATTYLQTPTHPQQKDMITQCQKWLTAKTNKTKTIIINKIKKQYYPIFIQTKYKAYTQIETTQTIETPYGESKPTPGIIAYQAYELE